MVGPPVNCGSGNLKVNPIGILGIGWVSEHG